MMELETKAMSYGARFRNPVWWGLLVFCLLDAVTVFVPYRFHGELMHGALRDGNQNAITWHLMHVLEKLEQGVSKAE